MPEKRRATLICLVLAAVTLGIYWPATSFDFINYDDPDYVSYNPIVEHGITREGIAWAFTTGHASNWHPLTWISHMADCNLYGPKSGGHHLTNILFHSANAVLLFLVLFQLTGAPWRSALVAALFAWHPLHVESVAWVSERKDVLSTFFSLLTISAYAAYGRGSKNPGSKSKLYYALALLCFTLGLLSKPMVVTLPFVLLLLDFWPLNRFENGDIKTRAPRLVFEKLPFLALAAIDCVATMWAQKGGHSVVSKAALSIPERIANALVSYVLYLWKMLWPMDLALPYPYSHQWSFFATAGAALILVIITLVALLRARSQPWLIVGWLWFLGTLVPVIGLVQVGIQFMADRYSYVPLIGIFVMIAWAIPAAWTRWPRPGLVFAAIVAAVLMFLAAGTETQLQYWRNSVTLFSHTVSVTHDNILAEYNLAEALASQGDETDAIVHYQRALAIKPNPVEAQYNSQPQARYNLGLIYRIRKQWADAASQFRVCMQEDPSLVRAHANLGISLIALHRDDEAKAEFQTAIRIEPSRDTEAQLLVALESAYAESGRFDDAVAAAQKLRDKALAQNLLAVATAAEKRIASYRAKQNATSDAQHGESAH